MTIPSNIIAIYNPLPWQIPAWRDKSPVLLLSGSSGGGKALDIDTPIPTPGGWTLLKNIQVMDKIFDENGKIQRVKKVSDVMQYHDVYKVTFDDGAVIFADKDHLWSTSTVASRASKHRNPNPPPTREQCKPKGSPQKRALDKIVTTEQIMRTICTSNNTCAINHAVPVAKPLQLPTKQLLIPPYVLGAWLGDGHSAGGGFTSADVQIIQEIRGEGFKVTKWASKYGWGILGLHKLLRELGLIKNKHIPPAYLRASFKQRMDLLAGLIDTDGHIDRRGHVEFCNTNIRIARGFHELAMSLGIKCSMKTSRATLYGKDCGERYRIHFTTTLPVARLLRKKERILKTLRGTQFQRYILLVERVESVPVKCIEVDGKSGLFLAGFNMIPTHNSRLAGEKIHALCKKFPNTTALVARKARETCAISVEPFMQNTIIGDDPECRFTRHHIDYSNGSEIIFVGMYDWKQRENMRSVGKHGRVDFVWLEEAIAFTEEDFNEVCGRMRGVAAKFTQIMLTTNPGPPTHWIHQRLIKDGEAKCYYSGAADNPHNPPSYINSLNRLTGIQRQRLVEGKWVAAEGGVYPEFDTTIHVIDPFKIPEDWSRYRSIDFGFNNPSTCQWWATDPDGRMYLYRETYQSELITDDFGKLITALTGDEYIQATVADHDTQERKIIQKAGVRTLRANKSVLVGIGAVKARLRLSGDGKPQLYIMRNCTVAIDQKMKKKNKPTCVADELPGYEWERNFEGKNVKEVPRKENDHGCDALRYMVMYLDKVNKKYDLSNFR